MSKEELKLNACVAGVMVIAVYGIYISGSLAAGQGMPDGPLFAGVLTAIGALFGYQYGKAQAKKKE